METSLINFVVSILISTSFALGSSQSFLNSTTDEDALTALKNSITSPPNGILLTNWSINTSVCDWIGVSCSTKHRVTALNLSGFELVGAIAPQLGNLTFLRSLDISFNGFTGSLPSQLSKLRRLEEINVGANNFTGEIPSWFGALSQLRHMRLNDNELSGRIPPSLFNISRLRTLDLSYNSLDENVPDEIGNFRFLETVNVESNKLTGPIPNAIFNISSLLRLNLGTNRLSGKIPESVCIATPKLRILYLFENQLWGEIPPEIYRCRELVYLSLAINRFTGNVPVEIGSLNMLTFISLWKNGLQGSIPKEFGNLTSLTLATLDQNNFTGELPGEVGNLASLVYFRVALNELSGAIPASVFNISTLQRLDLSFNQFSGTLPSTMGLSLPHLERLYLHVNRLSGPIPSSINNASNLNIFILQMNSFSGSIPNFPNLRLLKKFVLGGNNLSGAEEWEFLSSLSNCEYLEVVEVSDNPINGVLPSSIGNLSNSLQYFLASGSSIGGVIPPEIGNLSNINLLELGLHYNQLRGSIPTTIGNLKQLGRLNLSNNQLQGSIPIDLCRMSNLAELYLGDNVLDGPIPGCLGDVQSLKKIDFGSNKFVSTIPSNFWNLKDLVILNLSSNYLSGHISSQIEKLKVINQIDFSFNLFSGDIPCSIDGCQSLEFLTLSNNMFGGSIPQSFGNIRGLGTLDLSNNNISGFIPKSVEQLHFLEYFNVSNNRLQGEIPNGGAFANLNAQSFAHNSALCGVARFQVPPCAEEVHQGSRSKSVARLMKYILPPIIPVMLLVIIVVILIRRRRHMKIPLAVDNAIGTAWRITSYSELVQATNSFSDTNLLGRGSFGSVIKGTFSGGLDVAVKVFNLELEGANKSFETESRILSTIRHRNLVQIIGCCTNMEFKALILEFMPNGSMDKWLYSGSYCLDLKQMIEIAIDVALALEYLHHGNTFPIVHCDIKPSNVLLDEDMTARVADFGIAKLFDQGEAMIQTQTLATIGYAAPEYGLEGKVSTSADVYSYGIMLLEMLTRKKPTDGMFNGEMSLTEWVSEALQVNAINEILAPGLLSKEDRDSNAEEECVAFVFELAMKCLAISPNERINMTEAVATLHKIKAKVVKGGTKRRQQHAISTA